LIVFYKEKQDLFFTSDEALTPSQTKHRGPYTVCLVFPLLLIFQMFPMKVGTNFEQLQSTIFIFSLNNYSWHTSPSFCNTSNLPWTDAFLLLSLVETSNYMICLISPNTTLSPLNLPAVHLCLSVQDPPSFLWKFKVNRSQASESWTGKEMDRLPLEPDH